MLRIEARGVAIEFAGLVGAAAAHQSEKERSKGIAVAGVRRSVVSPACPVAGKAKSATLVAIVSRTFLNHTIIARIGPGVVGMGVRHACGPMVVSGVGVTPPPTAAIADPAAASNLVAEHTCDAWKRKLLHLGNEALRKSQLGWIEVRSMP